jgi:predicted transcriptional regulator
MHGESCLIWLQRADRSTPVGSLLECLDREQKLARRSLESMVTAGMIPRRDRGVWWVILSAPPGWPRTC